MQRDDAIDEKSTLQAMLNRRNNELEQLKADYEAQSAKLKQTIQAKIEALTKLDEIQSMQIELDFKYVVRYAKLSSFELVNDEKMLRC